MTYKEQICLLAETLKEVDADKARDVHEAVLSCVEYVHAVVAYESYRSIMRNVEDSEVYNDKLVELELLKRRNLRVVTLSMQILDRYCKLNDIEQIFKGGLDNRLEVADFATQLVSSVCGKSF